MSSGPLGELPGMRWCGETNRYYSVQRSNPIIPSNSYGSVANQVSFPKDTLESVRLAPVNPTVLASLPTHSRKRNRAESEDCYICLRNGQDHRTDPRMRFVQLPCKHSFHLYCIERWLCHKSGSCPLCRTPADTSLSIAAAAASNSLHLLRP